MSQEEKPKVRADQNAIYKVNWFDRRYPEENEFCKVMIDRVDDMGIWVKIPAYSNQEGMIPIGQFTKRKSRRVPKSIHIGTYETAMVTQIDVDKGNMDLTRQGLKDEDIKNTDKIFTDYRNLMNLLNYVATETGYSLQQVVSEVSYPLTEKYENAYIALQSSVYKPEILDQLKCPDIVKEKIREQIKRMAAPQESRVHTEFEAQLTTPEGVDGLRNALAVGYEATDDPNLQITVIAPPLYSANITTLGDEKGIAILNKVNELISEKLKEKGGRFTIKTPPKALSQKEAEKNEARLNELKSIPDTVDIEEFDE